MTDYSWFELDGERFHYTPKLTPAQSREVQEREGEAWDPAAKRWPPDAWLRLLQSVNPDIRVIERPSPDT